MFVTQNLNGPVLHKKKIIAFLKRKSSIHSMIMKLFSIQKNVIRKPYYIVCYTQI